MMTMQDLQTPEAATPITTVPGAVETSEAKTQTKTARKLNVKTDENGDLLLRGKYDSDSDSDSSDSCDSHSTVSVSRHFSLPSDAKGGFQLNLNVSGSFRDLVIQQHGGKLAS